MSEDRRTYIGSSDAADIMSDDWAPLYALKTGARGEPNLSRSFPVQFGLVTEPFHVMWTVRAMNEADEGPWESSRWAVHPPYEGGVGEQHWAEIQVGGAPLGSHPDCLIRHKETAKVRVLEVKHTARWGNAREAANHWMPQLQHHLLCWGHEELLFSVIVGNAEPERMWVGASRDWQDLYVDRAARFWWHVQKRQEPGRATYWGAKDETKVPQEIADSVPIDGLTRRDISTDNQARALVHDFLSTKAAAEKHDGAKAALKGLMKKTEGELYCEELTLKRNKKGAITLRLKGEASAEQPAMV